MPSRQQTKDKGWRTEEGIIADLGMQPFDRLRARGQSA